MSLSTAEVAHLLLALAVVLVAAHAVAFLFRRFGQPAVIGEIVGGLLLGPTVLGLFPPVKALFPSAGAVATGLNVVSQLGLLLLMFLAGAEMRVRASARERRTATTVAVSGLLIPFLAGIGIVWLMGDSAFAGPRGSSVTVALVFGIATAVAAIPVISRIMMDLRILDSPFGRMVMMVAVVEDAVLYILLAVVLGLATAATADAYGLWALVGTTATVPTTIYYVTASLLFFAAALVLGPRLFRGLARSRFNVVERHNPTVFRLVFLFLGVLVCVALGINPIFGALAAGICATRGDENPADLETEARSLRAWEAIKNFSLALFVPCYFALVGVKLDLVRHFDVVFFLWFLVFACVVKSASIWVASRMSGETSVFSTRLAVALNARGTVGVLVASVTLSAGVINEKFFAALVMISIVTSELAGFWLNRAFRPDAGPVKVETAEATGGR